MYIRRKLRIVQYPQYTRQTYNHYLHAVVASGIDTATKIKFFHIAGYCSRLDLAEKLKRQYEMNHSQYYFYDNSSNYSDLKVEICDVEEIQEKIDEEI